RRPSRPGNRQLRAGHIAAVPRRPRRLRMAVVASGNAARMTLIEWREGDRQFHLSNGRLSLILAIHDNGALGLLHLGRPLATGRSYRHMLSRPFEGFSNRLGDPVALECPTP